MSPTQDCPKCGSPLSENATRCPICEPLLRPAFPLPAEHVAGDTTRGVVDFELATAKAAPFTDPGLSERHIEVNDLDELWWVRSNLRALHARSRRGLAAA
jgi:uncharacterized Zn finger protein (UPF0148 family)